MALEQNRVGLVTWQYLTVDVVVKIRLEPVLLVPEDNNMLDDDDFSKMF